MLSTFTKLLGITLFAATASVAIYTANLVTNDDSTNVTPASVHTTTPNPHISQFVNDDGTFKREMKYQGPVDLSGYQVILDPLKGPMVMPMQIMACAATQEWMALSTGIGSSIVYALAVASNGDVYVGGSFSGVANSGNSQGNGILLWDKSANSWVPLGKGVSGTCYAIAIAGNGDVYAGGSFSSARNSTGSAISNTSNIAKWNGTIWSALGGGLASTVNDIDIDGTNLYAVGDFDNEVSGTILNKVGRWNGSSWNAMNGGVNNVCYAVAVGSGGDVYVGGDFVNAGSVGDADRIARWNSSGGWSALDNGTSGVVRAIAYVSNTEIYAGGEFTDIGTRVAEFNGTSWSNVSGGRGSTVHALGVDASGNLYAGGEFTGNFSKWDGSSWTNPDGGLNNKCYAITPDGVNVYAGGEFTNAGSKSAADRVAVLETTDSDPPVANCMPATVSLDISGNGLLANIDVDNGSSDACGSVTLAVSPNTFDCSHVGATQSVTLTVTDASTNSATCGASITIDDNGNCQGEALDFDGSNDWVDCGNILPTTSYSKEAWVYLKTPPSGTPNNNFISGTGAGGTVAHALWAPAANGYKLAAIHGGSSINDPASMPFEQWVHVAVTYDATTQAITLYKNGSQVAAGTMAPATALTVRLGAYNAGSNLLLGKMDEVRIWDRAICATQITSYKDCELTGNEDGLIAYYNFNQGIAGGNNSGLTTLLDGNSPANNGTLNGFALTGSTSNWIEPGGTVSGTCSAFTDSDPPTALCMAATVALDMNGNASILGSDVDDGSSDACSAVTLEVSPNTFDCSNVGDGDKYALDYDGSNDYVSVAHHSTLDFTDKATWEGWFKFRNLSTAQGLWNMRDIPPATASGYYINMQGSGGQLIYTQTHGGTIYQSLTATNILTVNQWHHIAFVKDGSTVKIYVDGVDETVTAGGGIPATMLSSTNDLFLGATRFLNGTINQYNNGLQDEIRIWNVARTQAQIQANMGSPISPNEPGLVAYFSMEDGPGSATLTDETGNTTGTLTNMDPATDFVTDVPAGFTLPGSKVTLSVTDQSGNSSGCIAYVTVLDNIAPTVACQDLTVCLDANGQVSVPYSNSPLANSVTDFSGTQGANGWQYGGYPASNAAAFSLFPNYSSGTGEWKNTGALFHILNATGGHPNENNLDWAVRRWTSSFTGAIHISGDFYDENLACGDGVHIRIFKNGTQVYQYLNVTTGTSTPYSLNLCVLSGDQIDFAIDPISNAICDATYFTAEITALGNLSSLSDNCGIGSIQASQSAFTCSDIATSPNTVTLTVTDINSNPSTCTSNVTVQDITAPTAICTNATLQLDASGNASIAYSTLTASSTDNCGPLTTTPTLASFDCNDVFPDLIISEYVEGSGSNKYIEIYNGTGQTVDLADYNLRLYSNGGTSPSPNNNLSAAGTLANGQVVVLRNSGATIYGGTTFSFTAINFNGDDAVELYNNVTQQTVDVVGSIGEDPGAQWSVGGNSTLDRTIRRNSNVTTGTNPPAGFASLGTEWTEYPQDDISGLGSHTTDQHQTVTVTDGSGNSSTCQALVSVEDIQVPTALCKSATVSLDASGDGTIATSDVDNSSSDNCDFTLAVNPSTFDCTTLGSQNVTLTATDASNNSASCLAAVTVEDNEAPTAICNSATVTLDAAGNGTLLASQVNNNSSDNCTAQGDLTLGLSQTSFDCGDANGYALDFDGIDDFVDLGAPSALTDLGVGDMTIETWIYMTSYPASVGGIWSARGGPTNEKAGFSVFSNGTLLFDRYFPAGGVVASTNTIPLNAWTHIAVVLRDNDDEVDFYINGVKETVSYTEEYSGGSVTSVTLGASLIGSNTYIRFFECKMDEVRAWNIARTQGDIQATQNTPLTGNEAGLVGYWPFNDGPGSATATDASTNSNTGTLNNMIPANDWVLGSPVGIPAKTITLTVTDASGNSSTCESNVTVLDNTGPTALCKPATVSLDASGNASIVISDVDNGSSDVCGCVSLAINPSTFNCSHALATQNVTLTATDPTGNSDQCVATVTVEDVSVPTAICQDITIQLDASGNYTMAPSEIDNNSSDACGAVSLMASPSTFDCSGIVSNSYALDFDGSNDYLSVPHDNSLNLTDKATWEGWFKFRNLSNAQGLWNMSNDTYFNNGYYINMQGNVGQIHYSQSHAGTIYQAQASSSSLVLNQWHHIAFVKDGSNVKIYVDGVDLPITNNANGTIPATMLATTGDLNMGVTRGTTAGSFVQYFNGLRDEIRIWNVARTQAQILANMNAQVNSNQPGLIAYYTMEGGPGTNPLTDRSSNTNAAALTNMDPASDFVTDLPFGSSSSNGTVTLTVTDQSGNSADCQASVTIEDNQAPTALCKPATVSLDASGNGTIATSDVDNNSSDNCDFILAVSPSTFDCTTLGSQNVTLTATDASSNSASCQAAVTVEDVSVPTANCQDITVQLNASGSYTMLASEISNNSSDVCSAVTLAADKTAFGCGDVGTPSTVKLTVTDGSGNSSICNASVTVEDNSAPTAICQDITVNIDASFAASIVGSDINNNSSDNCGTPTLAITSGTTSYGCSDIGSTYNVTLTVTDGSTHSSSCTADVTVADGSGNCTPAGSLDFDGINDNITIPLSASSLTELTVEMWVNADESSNASIFSWAATNGSGAPFIFWRHNGTNFTGYVNSSYILNTPLANGSWVHLALTYDGTVWRLYKNGSPAATYTGGNTFQAAASNIYLASGFNGRWKGKLDEVRVWNRALCQSEINNYKDCELSGSESGLLAYYDFNQGIVGASNSTETTLLDRTTNGNDGTLTGPFALTGTASNWTAQATTVSGSCTPFVDLTPPTANCQDITVSLNASGSYTMLASEISNNSSDDCSAVTLVADKTAFGCGDVGTPSTVKLTVTDGSTNSSTCNATVTVEDVSVPTANCQDITVELNASGSYTMLASEISNNSSDVCSAVTLAADKTAYGCSDVGTPSTVKLTVTDGSTNSATCNATVTVEDNTAPTAICQDATVQLDANGNGTLLASQVNNNSSDACPLQSVTVSPNTFDCSSTASSNEVTLLVTDVSGNQATCTASVTVVDQVAPSALCQDITVTLDANGMASIVPSEVDGGSSDNCSTVTLAANPTTFDCSDIGTTNFALEYDGQNDYVTTASFSAIQASHYTIEGWLNISAYSNGEMVVNGVEGITGSYFSIEVNSNGTLRYLHRPGGGNSGGFSVFSTTNVMDGNWHHFAAVHDTDNKMRLYIDGNAEVITSPGTIVAAVGAPSIEIGRNSNGFRYFGGSVDEIRIWGDARTASEILNKYNSSLSGSEADLLAYYPFNDGPGNVTAADASGNGNTATLQNMDPQTDWVNGTSGIGNGTSVILTVTDNSGNSTTCEAIVTVEDTQAPTVLCKAATVSLDASGKGSLAVSDIDNSSSDNCSVSLTANPTTFDCNHTGATQSVTLTATDPSGNSDNCTATVTVVDNIAPTAICVNNEVADQIQTTISGGGFTTAALPQSAQTLTVGTDGVLTRVRFKLSSFITLGTMRLDVYNGFDPATVTPADLLATTTVVVPGTGNLYFTFVNPPEVSTGQQLCFIISGVGAASINLDKNSDVYANGTYYQRGGSPVMWRSFGNIYDLFFVTYVRPFTTLNLDASGNGSIAVSDVNNGSNDNCSPLTLSINPTTFDCSTTGLQTVVLTATDPSGNSRTCSSLFSIEDNTPPTALCNSTTLAVALDASGDASIAVSDIDNGSSDECPGLSVAVSPNTFDCNDVGNQTVTLTGTDGGGNESTCTAVVDVQDNLPPTVVCGTVTVELDANGSFDIADPLPSSPFASISDNCQLGGNTYSGRRFSNCNDIGNPYTVGINQFDIHGNQASCNFTIVVEDNIAPSAICVPVTVSLDASGMAILAPSAIDNGSTDACGVSLSVSPNTFDCADMVSNPHAATLTVTDNNGNQNTCSENVTVVDNLAPTPICQNITVYVDGSGNAAYAISDVDNGSSDNCGPVSLPSGGANPGCVTGDYLVTLNISDPSGNTSSCNATVSVIDNTAPTAICQDITVDLNASGSYTMLASEISNNSSDVCSAVTLAADKTAFGCGDVGTPSTVKLTVTDGSTNSATCNATVTVEDNTAPTAICQDATVQLDANGNGTLLVSQVNNGSSDACTLQPITVSPSTFDCSSTASSNEVTLLVTDVSGNQATCTASVTVVDQVAPSALCKNATVSLATYGIATLVSSDVDNNSSDNCSFSLSVSPNTFDCDDIHTTQSVTLTITETGGLGQSDDCVASVTVTDPFAVCCAAPVANCSPATVSLDASGNYTLLVSDVDNSSTADCGLSSITVSPNTFDCTTLGSHNATLTITDVNTSSATCSTTVLVVDDTPPTAVCVSATVVVSLDGNGAGSLAASQIENGSTDNCGIATTTVNPTTFSCSDLGVKTVTLTLVDVNTNSSTCTTDITVVDTEDPTAICQDVTVTLDASGNGAIVGTDVDNVSSDNCGLHPSSPFSLSQSAFTCADVPSLTVTLTVSDGSSNMDQCTATVTVDGTAAAPVPDPITDLTTCGDLVLNIPTFAASPSSAVGSFSYDYNFPGMSTSGSGTGQIGTISLPPNTTGSDVVGTVNFVVTGNNGCPAATESFHVTVNPTPTGITATGTGACSAKPSGLMLTMTGATAGSFTLNSRSISPGFAFVSSTVNTWPTTGLAGNAFANDLIFNFNPTLATETVTYNLTPVSDKGCEGDPVEIEVDVDITPTSAAGFKQDMCSGDPVGIDLAFGLGATPGITYNWQIDGGTPPLGVTFASGSPTTGTGTGNIITDELEVSRPNTVRYTFTLTMGACVSPIYSVFVNIVPTGTGGCRLEMSRPYFDLSLTAEQANAHDVQLHWMPHLSEGLTPHQYTLEKKGYDGTFTKLLETEHLKDVSLYDHLDQTGMTNSNIYRVRVDFPNGQFGYSREVEVKMDYMENDLWVLYPSPATDRVVLEARFPLSQSEQWTYELTDLTGKRIKEGMIEKQKTVIQITNLAEGMYYLIARDADGKQYLNRLVKK